MSDQLADRIEVRRADRWGYKARFPWRHIRVVGPVAVSVDHHVHWSLTRAGAIRKARRHLAQLESIKARRASWEVQK